MIFENNAVELTDLPEVGVHQLNGLARNYLNVAYISTSIFYVLLMVGLLSVGWYKSVLQEMNHVYIAVAVLLVFYLLSMFLARLGFKVQGYLLRERDILYRRGVLFRSETVVPFNRVQHCEIKQGPIQRMFGLKSLLVFTAGGAQSDLRIPGLEAEKAQELKEFIIKTVSADETSMIK